VIAFSLNSAPDFVDHDHRVAPPVGILTHVKSPVVRGAPPRFASRIALALLPSLRARNSRVDRAVVSLIFRLHSGM
jgi:hypothetical protein